MARKTTKRRTPRQAPPKSKGGADAQTLFRPEYIPIIAKLAGQGQTRLEIAEFLDVSDRTLRRWCHRHPELEQALLVPETAANNRVIMSLYQQAIGYEREEEEIKVIKGKVVRVKIIRYYPPSASAAIFWAKAKAGLREFDPDDKPSGPADDGAATIDQTGAHSDNDLGRRINYLFEVRRRKTST